jgi:hypothetical protein
MSLRIKGRAEKDGGANTHYRTSDGSIITRELAVLMEKTGLLPDYHIFPLNGVEYLRDNRDRSKKDNIDEQPLLKITIVEKPKFKMTIEE